MFSAVCVQVPGVAGSSVGRTCPSTRGHRRRERDPDREWSARSSSPARAVTSAWSRRPAGNQLTRTGADEHLPRAGGDSHHGDAEPVLAARAKPGLRPSAGMRGNERRSVGKPGSFRIDEARGTVEVGRTSARRAADGAASRQPRASRGRDGRLRRARCRRRATRPSPPGARSRGSRGARRRRACPTGQILPPRNRPGRGARSSSTTETRDEAARRRGELEPCERLRDRPRPRRRATRARARRARPPTRTTSRQRESSGAIRDVLLLPAARRASGTNVSTWSLVLPTGCRKPCHLGEVRHERIASEARRENRAVPALRSIHSSPMSEPAPDLVSSSRERSTVRPVCCRRRQLRPRSRTSGSAPTSKDPAARASSPRASICGSASSPGRFAAASCPTPGRRSRTRSSTWRSRRSTCATAPRSSATGPTSSR